MEFRREVKFRKGHTVHISQADGQDYGVHGMEIVFLLHGPEATIQFLVYTGWIPEKTRDNRYGYPEWRHHAPIGADVGYHRDWPNSDYQADYGTMRCDHRPGGECYYDGSGLAADELLTEFFLTGEDAVWRTLEQRYRWHVTEATPYVPPFVPPEWTLTTQLEVAVGNQLRLANAAFEKAFARCQPRSTMTPGERLFAELMEDLDSAEPQDVGVFRTA